MDSISLIHAWREEKNEIRNILVGDDGGGEMIVFGAIFEFIPASDFESLSRRVRRLAA